ncbi:hypothetical protein MMC22_007291 [Lobaria immixta]|nr:hypothetical protein [Lobaria immixta]
MFHESLADVELILADVELILADVELILADVELILADVELILADAELILADVELAPDHRSTCTFSPRSTLSKSLLRPRLEDSGLQDKLSD